MTAKAAQGSTAVERADLRIGAFIPPFCRRHADPTLAIEWEYEVVEHLDRLGFHEVWIGEHHSGGGELISSPELFIAGAVPRTRQIKLGTGVISLPYHQPLMVADRIVQLDHQARGRAMFGFGPGLLPSDAMMLGIPSDKQRDRMVESLDVILRLLAGEVVTQKSEWFELVDARLQLPPYTRPRPHVAVASAVTPSGGKLAGRYGLGLLGVAAASSMGFGSLGTNWEIAEREAAKSGAELERRNYRLVAPFHLAESREQALREVEYGFAEWADYTRHINAEGPVSLGMASPEFINDNMMGAVGTVDDAVAALERFWEQSGGFGAILCFHHPWATHDAIRRSYRLFAEYVLPKFADRNAPRHASLHWLGENLQRFQAASQSAAQKTIDKHIAEDEASRAAKLRLAGQ